MTVDKNVANSLHRDFVLVTAERINVLLHPAQRLPLVLKAEITDTSRASVSTLREAQCAGPGKRE